MPVQWLLDCLQVVCMYGCVVNGIHVQAHVGKAARQAYCVNCIVLRSKHIMLQIVNSEVTAVSWMEVHFCNVTVIMFTMQHFLLYTGTIMLAKHLSSSFVLNIWKLLMARRVRFPKTSLGNLTPFPTYTHTLTPIPSSSATAMKVKDGYKQKHMVYGRLQWRRLLWPFFIS